MKVIFLKTAYTSIGFSSRYTGRFTIDGKTFTEHEDGLPMTILLPEKWVTVGKSLVEK